MDTKTSFGTERHTQDWVIVIGLASVYAVLYIGALVYSIDRSKAGNALLVVLSIVGAVIAYYVMMKLHEIFGPPSWDLFWMICCWAVLVFIIATIGHAVGAVFVPEPSVQRVFIASLPMSFVVVVYVKFIKVLIETSKLRHR